MSALFISKTETQKGKETHLRLYKRVVTESSLPILETLSGSGQFGADLAL